MDLPGAGGAGRQEDVYRIVRTAVETRRPIAAVYHDRRPSVLSAPLGTEQGGQQRVLCYRYGGESESGLKPVGSPDNWRCIALNKLASVELLDDRWRTAPNHSRPAPCIVDADVDAEDYPERDPQQGQ